MCIRKTVFLAFVFFIIGDLNARINTAQVERFIEKNQCWPDHIDTIYLRAGILALDSNKPIKIVREYNTIQEIDTIYGDELCLMDPYNPDSAITIFDTSEIKYPDTVSLGKYDEGTKLVFRYRVKNYTSEASDYIFNDDGSLKKHYTGQDRVGIDYHLSDTRQYVSASSILNDTIVGTGFNPGRGSVYASMPFKTINAQMTGIDVFKISRPIIADTVETSFTDSLLLDLYIPYKGNVLYIVEEWVNVLDTIDRRPDSTDFQVYYTTDGSDPSDTANALLYNDEPIVIKETTTLKAIGVLPYQPDSTTWYPSPVVEWKFVEENTSVEPRQGKSGLNIRDKGDSGHKKSRLYDIKGRVVKGFDENAGLKNRESVKGVYIKEAKDGSQRVREKVLTSDE